MLQSESNFVELTIHPPDAVIPILWRKTADALSLTVSLVGYTVKSVSRLRAEITITLVALKPIPGSAEILGFGDRGPTPQVRLVLQVINGYSAEKARVGATDLALTITAPKEHFELVAVAVDPAPPSRDLTIHDALTRRE